MNLHGETHAVAGFENYYRLPRLVESSGGQQSRQPSANDDDVDIGSEGKTLELVGDFADDSLCHDTGPRLKVRDVDV